MKNQQQAQKEEQQRIKNLVLHYDLQQSEDQDGETRGIPLPEQLLTIVPGQDTRDRPSTFHHNRIERPKDKGQRSRKLQLSDMDW
jgi:regulator of nonsense transcripts 2